jgi:hypothetical protein
VALWRNCGGLCALCEVGPRAFKGRYAVSTQRFDYQYTNIYRSTQDADLVIDGNEQQAAALEAALKAKYDHLQGSKSIWEVRLLGQKRGDKESLLGNPDFLNQHTDSNSTGMIELTDPPQGQARVRDLRDWNNPRPAFFEDARLGQLHFYFSELHGTTSRFTSGMNPPILAAVRYLTKAFQYELKIEPEDWKQIERIVREFNPNRDLASSYVKNWLEKNGPKLIQHAVNIEYAVDQMDRLGLRGALRDLSSPGKEGTLGWWMNKEPLRSKPVGQGTGRTAAELKITTLTHETNGYLGFESITRSHRGAPNVLISRGKTVGEAALYGKGHYTMVGRIGGRGTGWSVRYAVKPEAREGSDFTLHGNIFLLLNKSAASVIPETVELSLPQYLRLISIGDVEDTDRGLLERARQAVVRHRNSATYEDLLEAGEVIRKLYLPRLSLRRKPNTVPLLELLRFIDGHPDTSVLAPVLSEVLARVENGKLILLGDGGDLLGPDQQGPWTERLKRALLLSSERKGEAIVPELLRWVAGKKDLLQDRQLLDAVERTLRHGESPDLSKAMRRQLSTLGYFELITTAPSALPEGNFLSQMRRGGPEAGPLSQEQLERVGAVVRRYYGSKGEMNSGVFHQWLMLLKDHPHASTQQPLLNELLDVLSGTFVLRYSPLLEEVFTAGWVPERLKKECFIAITKKWDLTKRVLEPLREWLLKSQIAEKDPDVLAALKKWMEPPYIDPEQFSLIRALFGGPEKPSPNPDIRYIQENADTVARLWQVIKAEGPRTGTEKLGVSDFVRMIDLYLSMYPADSAPLGSAISSVFYFDNYHLLRTLDENARISILRHLAARSNEFQNSKVLSAMTQGFPTARVTNDIVEPQAEQLLGEFLLSREKPAAFDGWHLYHYFGSLTAGCGRFVSRVECFFRKQESKFYGKKGEKSAADIEALVARELDAELPRWRLLFRFFRDADPALSKHRELLLKAAKRANVYATEILLREVLGNARSAKRWQQHSEAAEALTLLSRRGGSWADPEARIFRAFRDVILSDTGWAARLPIPQILKDLRERTVSHRFNSGQGGHCLAEALGAARAMQ